MIIAFPFAFGGNENASEIGQARLFISMVRRFAPGHSVVQITDLKTREIEGADDCFRLEGDRLGEWYFNAMLHMPYPEFLRVDYDTIIRADVSHVFEASFDIAIAKERDGMMNNGVVFVKDRMVFADAAERYLDTDRDGWNDIQIAMQATIDSGLFRVRKLPEAYNCVVKNKIPSDAKILHFKGPRKSEMSNYRAVEELA